MRNILMRYIYINDSQGEVTWKNHGKKMSYENEIVKVTRWIIT